MFGLSDVRSARGAPPRGHDATGREAPTLPRAARGDAGPTARRSPRPVLRGPAVAARRFGAYPYGDIAALGPEDHGHHAPARAPSLSAPRFRGCDAARR